MIRIKNGLRSIVLHTRAIRSPLVDLFPPVETALRDESIYLSIGCESKLLFLYFPSDSLLRVMQCTGWKKKFVRGCHREPAVKLTLTKNFIFFFLHCILLIVNKIFPRNHGTQPSSSVGKWQKSYLIV